MSLLANSGALLGRLLVAALFIPAGLSKIGGFEGTVGYIASVGLPLATVAAVVAIVVEVLGGAALLLGWRTKQAALDLGCVYVGCNGTVPQLLGHARRTSVYAATHVHEKHRRGGWLVGAGLAGWWSMGSYSRDTKQLTVAGHHRVASSFLFYLFLGGAHV